jgi:hypothetical protein
VSDPFEPPGDRIADIVLVADDGPVQTCPDPPDLASPAPLVMGATRGDPPDMRSMDFTAPLSLLVALTLACQPSDPPLATGSDTGASDTGASTTGDTPTGDGESEGSESEGSESEGGADETPILERPPVTSHDCEATTPVKEVPGPFWHTDAVATLGDAVWLVRSDEDALSLSTLDADGTLGASVVLDGEKYAFRHATLVAADDRLAAAWLHATMSGEVTLRLAVHGADGAPEVAAHDLGDISGNNLATPRVVPRSAGGWSVFYATADAGGASSLMHVAVDALGEPIGAPHEVIAGGQTYGALFPSVSATDDGYAMIYSDDGGQGFEVFFVALDADAVPRAPARRISRAAGDGWSAEGGFSNGGMSLLAVGDGFWATWTESWSNGDFADPQGETTVHLGILDEQGDGPNLLLAAPVPDKREVDPALFAFGDRVGLMWTMGTIIFICGGCIADDDVKLVLLDPTTVAPASSVVTHLHAPNGFVRPKPAVVGDEILHTVDIDFHALTRPAVGATTCTPTP